MALFYRIASMIHPPVVALAGDNRVLEKYPEATAQLDESNLCFRSPEAGLSVCLNEEAIAIDLINAKLRGQIQNTEGPLAALRSGAWEISGASRWFFRNFSPETTLDLPITGPADDQHARVTREAVRGLGADRSLPFYGEGDDALTRLTREVAYRDHPPTEGGTYIDLMATLFNPLTATASHALRGVVVDNERGEVRLQTIPEARKTIRRSMDGLLTEIYQLRRQLEKPLPPYQPEPPLRTLEQELKALERSLSNPKTPGAAVAGIKKLRPRFRFARMRDVVFPDNDSEAYGKRGKLAALAAPHLNLLREIRLTGLFFRNAVRGQQDFFGPATAHYKELLRYLPEADWPAYATGRGPLLARGQLKLAAALHLAQDAMSHCRDLRGAVCQNYVSLNFWGLGDTHEDEDDQATDEDGKLKPNAQEAVEASTRILEIVQIEEPDEFDSAKEAFLNQYWPL